MMIQDIRSGTYSRSTPVVSAEGDYLVYTFYELTGDEEVGEGLVWLWLKGISAPMKWTMIPRRVRSDR